MTHVDQAAQQPSQAPRGSREWFLQKRRRRDDSRKGGRLSRFRDIGRRKHLTVEATVAGRLEAVFVSEFNYYMWNVEPVLCAYCNTRLNKSSRTRDHVIPRSAGGPNGDNLVPACAPCNQHKADDPLLVFLASR